MPMSRWTWLTLRLSFSLSRPATIPFSRSTASFKSTASTIRTRLPLSPDTLGRALYPFTGHFFDTGDGVRMHYLDEGQGLPIVMVHGNPTWSFFYRHLVRRLARNYRLT